MLFILCIDLLAAISQPMKNRFCSWKCIRCVFSWTNAPICCTSLMLVRYIDSPLLNNCIDVRFTKIRTSNAFPTAIAKKKIAYTICSLNELLYLIENRFLVSTIYLCMTIECRFAPLPNSSWYTHTYDLPRRCTKKKNEKKTKSFDHNSCVANDWNKKNKNTQILNNYGPCKMYVWCGASFYVCERPTIIRTCQRTTTKNTQQICARHYNGTMHGNVNDLCRSVNPCCQIKSMDFVAAWLIE